MEIDMSANDERRKDMPVRGEWATVGDQRVTKMSRPRFFCGVAGLVLIIGLFSGELLRLVEHAAKSEIDSHIILIPFISAYLLYIRPRRVGQVYRTSWLPGLVAAGAGVVVLALTKYSVGAGLQISATDSLSLIALSFLLFLTAGGFLALGAPWMKASSFAIGFLVFAIPMPDEMVSVLETGSKFASAEVANAFFYLSGTPYVRDGLIFQIPGIAIEVAQECSGIRSSWVLFITSILAAHMFLNSPGRRLVLVLAIIPLGLLRNGFRILVIGLLCVHIGPEMIDSVIHRRGGPLFFALSLVPLFLLLYLLRRQERQGSHNLRKNH